MAKGRPAYGRGKTIMKTQTLERLIFEARELLYASTDA